MSTGETARSGRSLPIAPLALAAVALLVVGVGVGWLLFGSGGDGSDTTADTANTTANTTETTLDGETEPTPANGDNADGAGDGDDDGDSSDSDSADASGDNEDASAASDDEGNPTVPTTAGSNSDGTGDTTTGETVEADRDATPDEDVPNDDPTEIETTTTTALGADGTRCPITPADLNGQSGVVKPGGDGICSGIEITLRSVVDSADIGTIDWANDLKLCEKHPSATQISFVVTSASGSSEVTDTFFRGDVPDGQDLVAALNVGFNGGYTSGGGVQPIAVCRTTDAEMVIVHR